MTSEAVENKGESSIGEAQGRIFRIDTAFGRLRSTVTSARQIQPGLGISGCVAKNMLGHKNAERHFSSGSNLEEISHESNLSTNVAFLDSFDLALPNHVVG